MKKRILCMILSIAVVISFMPLFTLQAEAFDTGAKTLVKTRTVTIKPGKTYKTPYAKLSKGMAFQVPLEIWLSPNDKGKPKYYINKGGYVLTLKNAKGKTLTSFKDSLKNVDQREEFWYNTWTYHYHKSIAKPCYGKGSYYFTIKNTTNRIIKVRYSIKGYRKFATSASLPKEKTMNADWYQYLGKVGPGIPLIKSVTSSNKDIDVDWYIKDNGVLYVYPYALEKDAETTLTVTLKNGGKKYKVKLLVKGYGDEEEEVDAEETLD